MATYKLNDGWIAVSPDEFADLRDDQNKLTALEAAGVDNWEGYSHAMDILYGEDEA